MEEHDDNIRKKIRSLDDKFPKVDWTPEEVWDRVGKKKRSFRYVGWSIAAAVLIGAAIIFWPDQEKVTITFREESEVPDTVNISSSWSLIEESCQAKVVVCESKEFMDLKRQWEELQKEAESIQEEERQYGRNPAISKARQKVESVKQDLEREMMSLIKS